MRILYLVRRADGGMRRHLISLIEYMNTEEFIPSVACEGSGLLARFLREKNIPIYSIDIDDSIGVLKDISNIVDISSILSKEKPDLLHVHGFMAWRLAVCANLTKRVATVVTLHNFPHKYGWMTRSLYRILSINTAKIIAVSNALKDFLISCNIPEAKIHVIHNGVDIRFFEKNTIKLDRKDDSAFIIGTIARLVPQKGIDILLRAFCELISVHNNLRLLIAGDGPSRQYLEDLCREKGIYNKVCFYGFVDNIAAFIDQLDVFVLPSFSEGFGISIIEAMACKKPVVASAVGGVVEIIQPGYTGYLVSPGDVDGLRQCLDNIINDRQSAAVIAQNGYNVVRKRFDIFHMIEKIENVYRTAIRS